MKQYENYTPSPNRVERIAPGVVRMELTQGKFAIVDESDLPDIMLFRWITQKKELPGGDAFYVIANAGHSRSTRSRIHLHRFLMRASESHLVDHWDGDPLNNRRHNLRIATKSQNGANQKLRQSSTSGYKGVYLVPSMPGYWRAMCRKQHVGIYPSPEEAARAYDDAARAAFGEFARVNFPMEGEMAA